MHTGFWRKLTLKLSPIGRRFSLNSFLSYGPLLVVLLSFYTIQLALGSLLAPVFYLGLGLVLITSGIFGMRTNSLVILGTIAAGELSAWLVNIIPLAEAVANTAGLLAAAAAIPVIARAKVVTIAAARDKLTRQQLSARLQLGKRLARGTTPNPMDGSNLPVANTENLVRNVLLLAKKSLKCRTAQFYWYDRDSDALIPMETISDCPEILSNRSISLGEGRLTVLKSSREQVSFRYDPHSPQRVPIYRAQVNISSIMAVPVHFQGNLAGAFLFDRQGPDPFFLPDTVIAGRLSITVQESLATERRLKSAVMLSEHLRQMNDAAKQFSTARTFEQVYDTAVRYTVGFSPFNTAILAHRIAPGGEGYEIVGVNRKQMKSLLGKRFELKDSLCGLAARARTYLPPGFAYERRMPPPFGDSVGVELEDGEPCLLLPLMARDEAVGFILLAETTKKVTKDDLDPLLLFAEYCAVSLVNAEANKELERMAVSDPLTAIPNHRAFRSRIVEATQRAERSSKPLSLLFLDIDHFKAINDTYGHSVGDVVLKAVARCVAASIRKVDFAARYGGEEFVAVLEETDSKGALIMAERLRQRVSSLEFEELKNGNSVTVSIGIATFPADSTSIEELIALADTALYRAKNDGRNQCAVA